MATKSEPAALGPVSLPAGSFDTEKLGAGLGAAAKAKPEDQAAAVDAAIAGSRQGEGTESRDPALIPGHAFVEVDGPFGKERRQVFAPPKGEQKPEQEAEDPATVEAAREKANVAAVKTQIAEAQKEGEVAPEPDSEPAAAPLAAPAAAPAAGDKN